MLFLDFETYYDDEYTLKKIETWPYIRDARFQCLGMAAWMRGMAAVEYIPPERVQQFLGNLRPTGAVAHNAAFDGAIASHHFNWTPMYWYDTKLMARYAISQGWLPPDHGTSIADFGNKGDTRAAVDAGGRALADYAARDVLIMMDIFRRFQPHIPQMELDLMNLHIKMTTEPVLRVDRALLMRVAAEQKHPMAVALRKNDKFVAALRHYGIEPATKTSPRTGQQTWAFTKTDDFMKNLAQHPHPAVRKLHELRTEAGSNIVQTRAKRFLEVGNPFPVPLLYYGAHCVPGYTEVLTLDGWRRIDEWSGGEIAQVTEEREVQFLPASRYAGPVVDGWIESSARYMPCAFTSGHRVPHFGARGAIWQESPAEEACFRSQLRVPVAGVCSRHGSITPGQARVLAMVQADGSFCEDSSQGRQLTIHLKKSRKIERARLLLSEAGIPFRERSFPSSPGYVRFSVSYLDYPAWLGPHRKKFGPWVLDSSPEAREALVTEAIKWDGHVHSSGQWTYSSSEKDNAEWLATLCHLTGRAASIYCKKPGRGRKANYVVTVRQRAYAMVYRRQWNLVTRSMRSYCPETKTGYWLARANGHIFVTGNTGRSSGTQKLNLQNLNRTGPLRRAVQAPPDHKLIITDLSQIEVRVLAWLAGDPVLMQIFQEGRDPYIAFAADVMFRKDPGAVTKEERRISKPPVLACGFGQGWRGLKVYAAAMGVILTDAQAEYAVNGYRRMYRRIPIYWDRLMDEVRRNHCLTLPTGRKLIYPDMFRVGRDIYYKRPTIFSKQRKGVRDERKIFPGMICENCVQAVARDVVMWQTLQLWPRWKVVLSIHDEAILCVPEGQAEQALGEMLEAFSTAPPWADGLPVTGEGGIYDNYGKEE